MARKLQRCDGQLELDLFAVPEEDRYAKFVARHKEWLREVKKCEDPALFELFDRLEECFGLTEAIERSKTFDLVTRHGFTIDELVDMIGLFTAEDYHTCWDRAWAFKQGVSKPMLPFITEWIYGM